jgi:miniconductance mechanosensitive channel
MFVFKDPILGFVGGIQLSANNMVRIGDWISMPKYGADGTVIEITITSVKVQNWDKTITTVPTYNLVKENFTNWRGMEESAGRRIKRSINIDMNSVRFCTPEMLENFKKIAFVSKYVDKKNTELDAFNRENNVDNSILVNGRRQTNLGIFRAYLKHYLHNKPEINDDMTFLVRQLQPTENGIPMEVYVFSRIQAWAEYEDIMADIFDHILAVIPHFDLRVFQSPTGFDLSQINLSEKK